MVSNGLSKRRGPIRRPKVCLSDPNPGRCHPEPPVVPPAPGVCILEPASTELTWGEDTDVLFHGVADDYPFPTVIEVLVEATGGEFGSPDLIFDDLEAVGSYIAPDEDGVFTLTATYNWPGGETCIATAEVTVLF